MAINVTDSIFDNPPKHRSQRGHFIVSGVEKINEDHGNKYKIQRAVRSSPSAEAYSCADSVDMLIGA
eukprot:9366535-Pyramimonas_sp.AAC.1